MKKGKILSSIKIKEIVILVLFIAITSFAIIEVKNLLNQEKIKNLTEQIKTSTTGSDGNILASFAGKEPIRVTGNAIAVLDIPAYGIRGQIVEGTDDETLKNYIGKFEGSAEPGQIGNFALAAHNNIYTEIFRNLHKVQVGDRIVIVTKTHEYIYSVTSTTVVDPSQTEVLDWSNKREITCITCTSAATRRVVVKGELVSERELNEQEIEEGVK